MPCSFRNLNSWPRYVPGCVQPKNSDILEGLSNLHPIVRYFFQPYSSQVSCYQGLLLNKGVGATSELTTPDEKIINGQSSIYIDFLCVQLMRCTIDAIKSESPSSGRYRGKSDDDVVFVAMPTARCRLRLNSVFTKTERVPSGHFHKKHKFDTT